MGNMTDKRNALGLRSLDRRPMLTAMMVYLIGLSVAALIVAFAVWRDPSCSPNPQQFHPRYMVSIAPHDPAPPRGLNAAAALRSSTFRRA